MSLRLERFNIYSRKDIHDLFSPYTVFQPQVGTWGLQGIVKVPDRIGDYVFIVTFKKKSGDYQFEESISESGILSWQSQRKQKLNERRILDFISHNHLTNNIYLFLRTSEKHPYTYLGKLAYLTHDPFKEAPVHFKWQIIDWEYSNVALQQMELVLVKEQHEETMGVQDTLLLTKPPEKTNNSSTHSRTFNGRKVDFAESGERNRSLGLKGENLVFEMERKKLIEAGRLDLAEQINHVSQTIGDGTGFDIQSFDEEGNKIFIEVKTTKGGKGTPFYMSASEMEFANLNQKDYYIYRIYDYHPINNSGIYFRLRYDELFSFKKEAVSYKLFPNS
jgi:Domain of unknown function (DUF3883)/Domain of unknown function (DUF3427)